MLGVNDGEAAPRSVKSTLLHSHNIGNFSNKLTMPTLRCSSGDIGQTAGARSEEREAFTLGVNEQVHTARGFAVEHV
jgi:hypothetical protein